MNRRLTLAARALALGTLLLGVLVTVPCLAQTLTFATVPATRQKQSVREMGVDKVNREDCEKDDSFTFTLNATVSGSFQLKVWAVNGDAGDCTTTDMQAPSQNTCREVHPQIEQAATTNTFKIRVQDIISEAWGPYTVATSDVCNSMSGVVNSRKLQFYLATGGAIAGTPQNYVVHFDLLGPDPPTSVKAGIGERALVVSWREPGSAVGIKSYRIYADPVSAPADGDGGAAGAPSDGGIPTECVSDDLIPGQAPPASKEKGETNSSTTQSEAKNLRNGVRYAVAVASVDDYYNAGLLSRLTCATPEPVTGFYESYRAAGGGAGGGYCAIGATRSRLSAAGIALAAFGLVIRRIRRRAANANVRGAS